MRFHHENRSFVATRRYRDSCAGGGTEPRGVPSLGSDVGIPLERRGLERIMNQFYGAITTYICRFRCLRVIRGQTSRCTIMYPVVHGSPSRGHVGAAWGGTACGAKPTSAVTLLLSRSQVTAQGTQVMTQVLLGTAGACNARRSHVRSSTKLAPSRRVSTKIGSASVVRRVSGNTPPEVEGANQPIVLQSGPNSPPWDQ